MRRCPGGKIRPQQKAIALLSAGWNLGIPRRRENHTKSGAASKAQTVSTVQITRSSRRIATRIQIDARRAPRANDAMGRAIKRQQFLSPLGWGALAMASVTAVALAWGAAYICVQLMSS